jgi:hypothetical protein
MNGSFLAVGFNMIRAQFHLVMLTAANKMGDLKLDPVATVNAYSNTAVNIDQALETLNDDNTGFTKRDVLDILVEMDNTVEDTIGFLTNNGYRENGPDKPLHKAATELALMMEKFANIAADSELELDRAPAEPPKGTTAAGPQPGDAASAITRNAAPMETHDPFTCPECGEPEDVAVVEVPMYVKDIQRAFNALYQLGILLPGSEISQATIH